MKEEKGDERERKTRVAAGKKGLRRWVGAHIIQCASWSTGPVGFVLKPNKISAEEGMSWRLLQRRTDDGHWM